MLSDLFSEVSKNHTYNLTITSENFFSTEKLSNSGLWLHIFQNFNFGLRALIFIISSKNWQLFSLQWQVWFICFFFFSFWENVSQNTPVWITTAGLISFPVNQKKKNQQNTANSASSSLEKCFSLSILLWPALCVVPSRLHTVFLKDSY